MTQTMTRRAALRGATAMAAAMLAIPAAAMPSHPDADLFRRITALMAGKAEQHRLGRIFEHLEATEMRLRRERKARLGHMPDALTSFDAEFKGAIESAQAAEDAMSVLIEARHDELVAIFLTPALTLQGLAAKVTLIKGERYLAECAEGEPSAYSGILDDIARLVDNGAGVAHSMAS
jgi:hypothetical protein